MKIFYQEKASLNNTFLLPSQLITQENRRMEAAVAIQVRICSLAQ